MISGIYKITNLINGKCYIGKARNMASRWSAHRNGLKDPKQRNKTLYKAFLKYGLDNFSFEVIEKMSLEEYDKNADEREKYWIEFFDSKKDGYNETDGGDGGRTILNYREKFGKLTEEEVYYLRERYLECKYPASYIYENEFKDRITLRGFRAIWTGQNSKDILYEVYTPENKKKQVALSRKYEGVLRRKISLEETLKIRERIEKGESITGIWKKEYSSVWGSASGFRDAILIPKYDEEVKLDGTIEPIDYKKLELF